MPPRTRHRPLHAIPMISEAATELRRGRCGSLNAGRHVIQRDNPAVWVSALLGLQASQRIEELLTDRSNRFPTAESSLLALVGQAPDWADHDSCACMHGALIDS
jgi:hypothetical protein